MPSGELISAADRFDDRRRRAEGPFSHVTIDQADEFLKPIQDVYNRSVQPVVTILEEAEYMDEAKNVSRSCTTLILHSRNAETIDAVVRALAEQQLREIDPILYAHAFRQPDLSE